MQFKILNFAESKEKSVSNYMRDSHIGPLVHSYYQPKKNIEIIDDFEHINVVYPN